MKRKGLWLLAVAVPLIGLVLVWRVGQRARDEADVCEAVLRSIIRLEHRGVRPVFVSIEGRDPSTAFLRRFDGFEPVVLPASALHTPAELRGELLFDIKTPHWNSPEQADVSVERNPRYRSVRIDASLQRRSGQWTFVSPNGWPMAR